VIALGGALGILLGGGLAAGLIAISGLPVFGPAGVVAAFIASLGPAGVPVSVVAPTLMLFGAGLGLLVATIFFYALCAVTSVPAVLAGPPFVAPPLELFGRGVLIGMAGSVNFAVMSAIPWLWPAALPLFALTLLAFIPGVPASLPFQVLQGAAGWVLPLNYLMIPLGTLLFLVNLPTGGGIRLDPSTMTIESRGGFVGGFIPPTSAFNVGNFTFLPPTPPPLPLFTATPSVSVHETGHTLSNAAFGGFFYWIGAIDELAIGRGATAYSELMAESHLGGAVGGPFLPMW
jgi:hypothetical protein